MRIRKDADSSADGRRDNAKGSLEIDSYQEENEDSVDAEKGTDGDRLKRELALQDVKGKHEKDKQALAQGWLGKFLGNHKNSIQNAVSIIALLIVVALGIIVFIDDALRPKIVEYFLNFLIAIGSYSVGAIGRRKKRET